MVGGAQGGKSLRQFLKSQTEWSSKKINTLIDRGCVLINGQCERHGSKKVKPQAKVSVQEGHALADQSHHEIEEKRILFQDSEIVAYDKPAGIPSQQTLDGKRQSVETLLKTWWKEKFAESLTLLHRLDRDTTGVLLFSRNEESRCKYFDYFKSRQVQKQYLALCHGWIDKEKGVWEQHLGKTGRQRGVDVYGIVRSGGKKAITAYEIICGRKGHSLWLLCPHTGRTHQLRVQLAHAGFPILGDSLYGREDPSEEREQQHFLHAWKLRLPDDHLIEAPVPDVFNDKLLELGMEFSSGLTG